MKRAFVAVALLCVLGTTAPGSVSGNAQRHAIREVVDSTIPALMTRDHIPGMAVAVTVRGTPYVFTYGVASVDRHTPVTGDTLFEIGSVTKTFTATLASLAAVQGDLSLSETTATYLPEMRGTPFGSVTLLSLGTHTPGGLPLQFPGDVRTEGDAIAYFKRWRPTYAMGTYRTYANPGIAMLGFIAAKSMGGDFRSLMQQRIFQPLGLRHTFIGVPEKERAEYAWGYGDDDKAIRMGSGALSDEAYGITTTANDLIRFVQENLDPSKLSPPIRTAIADTQTGYFRAGPMTQDLIWEQYSYPVALSSLQTGNSPKMIFDAMPVRAIVPPEAFQSAVWVNKTGTTNGFGTYVAFIPSKRLGIVLLANKSYPIHDRVAAAYRIINALLSP